MTTQELQDMLLKLSQKMISEKNHLCQLDSFIGDGDHGLTVERGFKAVQEVLCTKTFENPAAILRTCGDTLMNAMGGAIGPILGSFFRGGCKKMADATEMNADLFEIMLQGGLRQVKLIGEAEEGDRTLVDALAPAAAAFSKAKADGLELGQCMDHAALAAEKGTENTKNMVAKRGRAKFLGEKSMGYVDAGATTMSIILRFMSNYINHLN